MPVRLNATPHPRDADCGRLWLSLWLWLLLALLPVIAHGETDGSDVAADGGAADLVFVHLSDIHLTDAERNPPPRHPLMPHTKDLVRSARWLEATVAQINETIEPDFVVITGDLVDGAGEFPDNLQRVRRILDELECPYHVLIGNHERPARDDFMRVFDTPVNFTFTHGRWRFIALDGSRSALSDEALDFLRQALGEAEPDDRVVVMNHYPLHLPQWFYDLARTVYPRPLMAENGEKALALIDRQPAVRMVLAGHVHHDLDDERRGVHHITAGSIIKPPHRFRVIRLRDERIEWEFHDVRLIEPGALP